METQDQNPKSVALIIGVTGISGLSLAEALKNPTTPGSPWKVYGAARRPPPGWVPTALVDRYITLDALDSADAALKLSPISQEITHLFWVPLQVQESEEVNIFRNSTMLKNVLSVIVDSNDGRCCLRHVALLTGTKHYMGPIFDPSLAGQLMPCEVPFREDSPRLPFPNFYYALEDIAAAYSPAVTYSVHRSSIIFGASPRSLHNSLLTLAVYATICKYQGLPFRFFGNKYTWEHFCDASSVDCWQSSRYGQQRLMRPRTKHLTAQTATFLRGGAYGNCSQKSLTSSLCRLMMRKRKNLTWLR